MIKIQRGAEPNSVRKFLRETSVLRRMDHPMTPRLLDCGREGVRLFLVTPTNHSLAGKTRPGGFSINEELNIVAGVADALGHAHRTGIGLAALEGHTAVTGPGDVVCDAEPAPAVGDTADRDSSLAP